MTPPTDPYEAATNKIIAAAQRMHIFVNEDDSDSSSIEGGAMKPYLPPKRFCLEMAHRVWLQLQPPAQPQLLTGPGMPLFHLLGGQGPTPQPPCQQPVEMLSHPPEEAPQPELDGDIIVKSQSGAIELPTVKHGVWTLTYGTTPEGTMRGKLFTHHPRDDRDNLPLLVCGEDLEDLITVALDSLGEHLRDTGRA